MTDNQGPNEGEPILYQTQEGTVRIEVLYESETFWLNLKKIAELFGVELPTMSYHLKEIYGTGELTREATLRKIRRVQREGEVSGEIRASEWRFYLEITDIYEQCSSLSTAQLLHLAFAFARVVELKRKLLDRTPRRW